MKVGSEKLLSGAFELELLQEETAELQFVFTRTKTPFLTRGEEWATYDDVESELPSPDSGQPIPRTADFVNIARAILHSRPERVGVVLSIVRISSRDSADLVDRRTHKGRATRQVLDNPPVHLATPEVYEIEWRPKPGRVRKIYFVWTLSNQRSTFPVGGILFLTTGQIKGLYLATFNVGALDDKNCTNVHHSEMQATRFIMEQAQAWRKRIDTIDIWNLSRKRGIGYSPCNACCVDLAAFLTRMRTLGGPLRRASMTWLTLYDRNKLCGHPTDPNSLTKMARAGWLLTGPGKPVRNAVAAGRAPMIRPRKGISEYLSELN